MAEPRIVVMGVAAAGKTSVGRALAGRLGMRFVDADDLHPPANVAKMASGTPLTDGDREPWLDAVGVELHAASPTVVACSALRAIYRDHLRASGPFPLQFVLLDVGRAELQRRIHLRTDHFMPPSLLDDQLATLEPPTSTERDMVTIDAAQPLSAVVDAAVAALDR